MGLNRLMIGSSATQKNVVTMTMGSASNGYIGFRNYGVKYGEIEGEVMYYGKAVAFKELSYFNDVLYLRFKIDGITSSSCRGTINMTEVDTGMTGTTTFDGYYYSGNDMFIYSASDVPSDFSRFFVIENVGKKYTVKFIFE